MSITLKMALLDSQLARRLLDSPTLSQEIEIDPAADDKMRALGIAIERSLSEEERPEEILSLGKDWDLLNHLFTNRGWRSFLGSSWPNHFLTKGGRAVGEGAGYGPGRLLDAQDAADVDSFLSAFDLQGAIQNLTLKDIRDADIYSIGQSDTSIDEVQRIARVLTEELQGFMRRASTTGSSVYIFLI